MGNENSNQPPPLTEKDVQFILTNSGFTREQVYEWHGEFLKECPSGKIKRVQFESICQQQDQFSHEVKRYCKFAFRTFDKDNSGSINFQEFVLAISSLSSGDITANLRIAFKMYDLDGNGTISQRELKKIIKALYKLRGITKFYGDDRPSERVKRIFEKYDTSKDNKINEAEFIEACMTDPHIRSLLI